MWGVPRRLRQSDVVFEPIIASAPMKRLSAVLTKVAAKDVTVTLIGESGVGKEILARRVHELSKRRSAPFIPINCAAIPDALFESELFGHERGAFTGASEQAKGKVEAAEGGTLFLDEVGEMPLPMQAKLLRFLENRRFMRVGGTRKIQADIRLVFATLRPLEDEVRAGRFRADLYYRIQGITLNVPPLRERRADIPLLVEHFTSELSARHGTEPPRLTRQVRHALATYDWPGNVRELRNVLEALCLLRAGKQVRLHDLPEALRADSPKSHVVEVSLDHPLDEIVGKVIDAALDLEGGNRVRAAARLGVSVRTVQRHLHASATSRR
jgi:transcriptional regulator with PAS, ATPase and Fis domain